MTFALKLRLVFEHSRAKVLDLLRQPSYVVGTLVFPSLFFLFFAAPNATSPDRANLLLASFAAFAVLGVVFFQFGMDLAVERNSPWAHYVRSLPLAPWQFLLARSLAALIFATAAALTVVAVVLVATPAHLSISAGANLGIALIAGSLPFCLLGICIGSLVPSSSALPITNLLYLVLSFAGGLWLPPAALAPSLQKISVYLPTRAYGEWAWAAAAGNALPTTALITLILYSAALAPLAWFSQKRRMV